MVVKILSVAAVLVMVTTVIAATYMLVTGMR